MSLLFWLLGAIGTQVLFNWISKKINYEYSKKMEMLAVGLNVAIWWMYFTHYGLSIDIVIMAVVTSILLSIIFIDLKYYEIPNEYNLALYLLGIFFIVNNLTHWNTLLLGGVVAFVLYLVLMILSRGSLGGGDVKLAGALGLYLGIYGFWNFFAITFLTGAFISLVLLLLKMKKKDDKIAFGPYICIAFLYVILFA